LFLAISIEVLADSRPTCVISDESLAEDMQASAILIPART
jgi:hypothetical protein